MTKIYPPHITAQIFDAMASAEMGNNGHADMPKLRDDVASALEAAGYTVCRNPAGLYGPTTSTVFTRAAWAAFRAERTAERHRIEDAFARNLGFDVEGAILARQERHAARQDAA